MHGAFEAVVVAAVAPERLALGATADPHPVKGVLAVTSRDQDVPARVLPTKLRSVFVHGQDAGGREREEEGGGLGCVHRLVLLELVAVPVPIVQACVHEQAAHSWRALLSINHDVRAVSGRAVAIITNRENRGHIAVNPVKLYYGVEGETALETPVQLLQPQLLHVNDCGAHARQQKATGIDPLGRGCASAGTAVATHALTLFEDVAQRAANSLR
mmetsp:Transcript_22138/g.51702  ORF Transcript_22138/g.51702 Transcript_22138/m.51702 type:complete len:215 (-) Transcript_22138:1640-2284(-)